MGRQGNFAEKTPRGPGRKAKKQKPPTFLNDTSNSICQMFLNLSTTLLTSEIFVGLEKKEKLGRRSQKRAVKRIIQKSGLVNKPAKPQPSKTTVDYEESSDEESDKLKLFPENDDVEDESSNEDSPIQDRFDNDEEESSEDEEFSIEKKSKKLRVKEEIDEQLAEDELNMNVETRAEKYLLPENEELAKEAILPPDLTALKIRINEVIGVLNDFSNKRDQCRSRIEYVELLRQDLCSYYSYNQYLMERLMEIFPLHELIEFLEANEVPDRKSVV